MSTTLALVLHSPSAPKLLAAAARGTILANLRPMGRGKDYLAAWGCDTEPQVSDAFLLAPTACCVYGTASHPPIAALVGGAARSSDLVAELLYFNESSCGIFSSSPQEHLHFPLPRSSAEAAAELPEHLLGFVVSMLDLDASEREEEPEDAAASLFEGALDATASLFEGALDDTTLHAFEREEDDAFEDDDREFASLFADVRLRDAEEHEAALAFEDDYEDEDDDDDDDDDEDDDDAV
jgi:hypothetical protein